MYKFLFILFTVATIQPLSAQINKGAIILGGDIGYHSLETEFNTNSKEEQKLTIFSPSIGSAIRPNLILGIDLLYSNYEMEDVSSNYMEETKMAGGGVFLRQYRPLSNSFHLFGQARLGYVGIHRESGSDTNLNARSTSEGYSVGLALHPGIAFRAGKRLFLELALNNLLQVQFEKTENTSPSFGGGFNVTERKGFSIFSSAGSIPLNVGLRFIFSK